MCEEWMEESAANFMSQTFHFELTAAKLTCITCKYCLCWGGLTMTMDLHMLAMMGAIYIKNSENQI